MHGTGYCSTQAFPLKCRYCGGSVFFFRCSCGSRVLFDELGPPWPVHDCGGSGSNAGGGTFGLSPDTASQVVRAYAARKGLPVPRMAWEPDGPTPPPAHPPPIVRVDPVKGVRLRIVGVVREVSPAVPLNRRFGVRAGSLLDRQLQRHLPAAAMQVTVHEEALEAEQLSSYTFLAPTGLGVASGLARGEFVEVELRGVVLTGVASVWLATAVGYGH